MSRKESSLFSPHQMIPGDYELLEFIDAGGFGEVWLARETILDRKVALKFILRLPRGDDAARHILEEGRRLSMLSSSRHKGSENILYIHHAFPGHEGIPAFLELEWMAGGSLQSRIDKNSRLSQEDILDVAIQIGNALSCAHEQRFLHCDIKPSNILASADVHPIYKLGDFGLSRSFSDLGEGTSGTPPYMSPEQFRDPHNLTSKTDIYSLGVVLFQCAEGKLPYRAKNHRNEYQRLHCEAPVPEITNSHIAPELRSLIVDCLSKQPSLRPDATDFLHRVHAIGHVRRNSASPVHIDSLYVKNASLLAPADSVLIENRDIDLDFEPGPHGQWHVPTRLITNKDYYRFLDTPGANRWRPDSMSFADHDGAYLQHWFMGKPLGTERDRPLSSISHGAAAAFAQWLGGILPSMAELEELMDARPALPIVSKLRQYAADGNLPVLQFWCRDEGPGSDRLKSMWCLLPESSYFRRPLARVRRPAHFCFPHYLFLVVLPKPVVEFAREKAQRPGHSSSSFPPSSQQACYPATSDDSSPPTATSSSQ